MKLKGKVCRSKADTEVVAHLLDKYYEGNLLDAVYATIARLKGAYALGVVSANDKDRW